MDSHHCLRSPLADEGVWLRLFVFAEQTAKLAMGGDVNSFGKYPAAYISAVRLCIVAND